MKRHLAIIICIFIFLIGCSPSAPAGKVSAADAIKVVQESESTYPGTKTTDAIAGLLKIMKSRGAAVDVIGWSQDYKTGGTHDVWFKVKIDNSISEFHWIIGVDGIITPANKIAQNVTKAPSAARQ